MAKTPECGVSYHIKHVVKFVDAFTDKDENIDPAMPGSEWSLEFHETGDVTRVNIVIRHKTLANLEAIIAMGFKGGFTMTLDYLEQFLSK